jgi:hypothetical protein
MKKVRHPPHSPDLVPPGGAKRLFGSCSVHSGDELLSVIQGILSGIEKSILIGVSPGMDEET